ncbi:MAG: ATP-binding cassette domain-containing protein [Bacteroidales bacterium]|nr:ATP-binding cassette domain-containing protein [Bacteroidales bacterium]
MITIDNIKFSYAKHEVFDNLSLRFDEGTVYGLLGLNGAGKSTLLYLISGLLFPQEGRVEFNGHDMSQRNPNALADLFLVPEEFELPRITFEKYVRLNAPFYPKFSRETLDKCLSGFNMTADIRLDKLSMGQKKKAFVCFALAANTSLLIMDEPTNGLDIPSKSQFRQVVSSCMDDNRTIIISTHQVRDVENLIDHITIINEKKCVFDASVSEITEQLTFSANSHDDALYSQDNIGGGESVCKRQDGDPETPLNIELLFNAVLTDSNKISQFFTKK